MTVSHFSSPSTAGSTILNEEFPQSLPSKHHPEYYFCDGNLVIMVEATLFRVFRSTFIRHSSVFSDLFSLPEPIDQETEGSSDENPLFFSGISVVDFERLLWVIYPSAFGVHRAQTLEEWTSILSLATRWEFSDIRSLAIRSLQSLNVSPVDRIVLSRDFDISGRWTLAAYTTLCERPDPLTFSEASKLGLEDSIRVAQLREQLRGTSRSGGYRSLTRAAAARREPISPPKPPRQERLQWDIGRSFFDQGDIPPPIHRPSIKRGGPKAGTNLGLNRTARMVVEVFGLGVGRRSPSC